jgi:hypothetical protein
MMSKALATCSVLSLCLIVFVQGASAAPAPAAANPPAPQPSVSDSDLQQAATLAKRYLSDHDSEAGLKDFLDGANVASGSPEFQEVQTIVAAFLPQPANPAQSQPAQTTSQTPPVVPPIDASKPKPPPTPAPPASPETASDVPAAGPAKAATSSATPSVSPESAFENNIAASYVINNPGVATASTYDLSKQGIKTGSELQTAIAPKITLLFQAHAAGLQAGGYQSALAEAFPDTPATGASSTAGATSGQHPVFSLTDIATSAATHYLASNTGAKASSSYDLSGEYLAPGSSLANEAADRITFVLGLQASGATVPDVKAAITQGFPGSSGAETPSTGPASNSTLPASSNPPSVLTKATISAAGNLNVVTTTLFAGAIRAFNQYPGVTLYASAVTSNPSSQATTKYSDVQMLTPEGATLGLYLSPFSQNPFATTFKTTGTAFSDRAQTVDRRYFATTKNSGLIPSSLDENTKITEIDDPITLLYIRDGVGAKMINRNTAIPSGTTTAGGGSPPAGSSTGSTNNFGLAGAAYLGAGLDGGFLGKDATGKSSDAGVFRLESLLTATWADKESVLALYPTSPPTMKDAFYGVDSRMSISINSNIKASFEYSVPIGGSKGGVGKAVLFGVTVSQ